MFMSIPKRMRSTLASRGQPGQHFAGRVGRPAGGRIRWQSQGGIFDEVAVGVFIITDGRLHGDGPLAIFSTCGSLSSGMPMRMASSSRFGSRPISCNIWREMVELVDGLDHVHRDTDGTGLIRDGAVMA